MSKKLSLLIFLFFTLAMLCTTANASSTIKPVINYSPATESIINGVPISEHNIKPNWVSDPIYDNYIPSNPSHIDYFKLIASSYIDNRSNSTPYVSTLTINQSSAQGSEWNGNVSFTGEIKAGMIGKISTQVSGGVKEYRQTNEAVGASGTMTVPPYKQGRHEAYYGGISSNGTLYWHIYDDVSGRNTYYTTPVNCKVHKNYLDVNFKPIIW